MYIILYICFQRSGMDKLSVLHPSPSWSGFWLPRHSLIDCGPGPHQFAKGRHSMLDDFPWNYISLLCINRIFMDFQCISKERWKDQISNIEPYWACSWGFGQERNCTSTRCPSVKVHLLPVDMFAWPFFFKQVSIFFCKLSLRGRTTHIFLFFAPVSPNIAVQSQTPPLICSVVVGVYWIHPLSRPESL